jgi:type II secretory pathway component PulK
MEMGVVMTLLMVGMMVLMVGGMAWSFLSGRMREARRHRASHARMPRHRV